MCVTYIADMETSKYKNKWPNFHTQPFLMAPNGRHKKMGESPIYVLMGELLKAVKAVWPKSQVSIVVTSRNKSRVFHFFSATQILIIIIVSILPHHHRGHHLVMIVILIISRRNNLDVLHFFDSQISRNRSHPGNQTSHLHNVLPANQTDEISQLQNCLPLLHSS